MIQEKEIKEALDKAYKEAGPNAYFGEGFIAGVAFAVSRQADRPCVHKWARPRIDIDNYMCIKCRVWKYKTLSDHDKAKN